MGKAVELEMGEIFSVEDEQEMILHGRRREAVNYRNERRITRSKLVQRTYLRFKRVCDISLAGIGLVAFSPIFLIVAVMIKLDRCDKGPVLYKHMRVGKDGKTIYLYKFRSMRNGADKELEVLLKDPKVKKQWEENFKLASDPRVTRIGKILRKSSIDELPQLINILKGDMSLIGPRPLVEEELEKYGVNREKFLSVKPGVTGWWACNGRSETTYRERVGLELYYVDNLGPWIDLKIICKTIWDVLKGRGAK